jgi:hypothetical protein
VCEGAGVEVADGVRSGKRIMAVKPMISPHRLRTIWSIDVNSTPPVSQEQAVPRLVLGEVLEFGKKLLVRPDLNFGLAQMHFPQGEGTTQTDIR